MTVRKPRERSYAARLDRVLDHITEHLDEELSLATLARVAGFSPFHFHRLFQGHVGETVHAHVKRMRVERAASIMRAQPRRSLTELALECGFPALSDLSRAFKARFGIAPSAWDRVSPLPASKLEHETLPSRAGFRAKLATLPRSLFVYTRVANPYGNQRLVEVYESTRRWLDAIGRTPDDVVFAGMSIDDPAVTPLAQCRYDLGIVFPMSATGVVADIARARRAPLVPALPSPVEVERAGLSVRRFAELDLVTVHCDGTLDVVAAAWTWLYGTYLPRQSRLPANHPAMELFVRLPEHIGWERFDLLACVPLR
ncbi:MAG TPA: helix-turn-helix domain-containing protein [Kofleriaceae bacterium]|nr:helix-turn-helix domain-containing protein [Kofleriaceae bacterium]